MNSASQILDTAERRMRTSGYNAVSYRDIAAEIGIKSSSLHYHFPKKEDLGVALVRRYTENFRNRLTENTANDTRSEQSISAFIDMFRYALEEQRLVCLCAIFGAEAPGLPHSVTTEVKSFFKENTTWLSARYEDLGHKPPLEKANTTLALLQGAMIMSSVNGDNSIFGAAVKAIEQDLN